MSDIIGSGGEPGAGEIAALMQDKAISNTLRRRAGDGGDTLVRKPRRARIFRMIFITSLIFSMLPL